MNRRHLSIIPLLGSVLILPINAVFPTNISPTSSIQVASSLSSTQIRQLAQAGCNAKKWDQAG